MRPPRLPAAEETTTTTTTTAPPAEELTTTAAPTTEAPTTPAPATAEAPAAPAVQAQSKPSYDEKIILKLLSEKKSAAELAQEINSTEGEALQILRHLASIGKARRSWGPLGGVYEAI